MSGSVMWPTSQGSIAWPLNGSPARLSLGLKMTVPSPYRVNDGAWVNRKPKGTKPPPCSMRSTMSVRPVGCEMSFGPKVGEGVGEGLGVGPGGVVGLGEAPGPAVQAAKRVVRASASNAAVFVMAVLTPGCAVRFLRARAYT